MLRFAFILVFLLFATGMSRAETYCGKADRNVVDLMGEGIFGDWTMTPLEGYAMQAGNLFPFPPMAPITMSIFPGEGGRIFAVNPELTDRVELVADDEPHAALTPDDFPEKVEPRLDDQDLSIVAGCDLGDLPRLVARSQVLTKDSEINSTMRLVVIGPGIMYGMIHSTGTVVGDSFRAVRAISLTR